MIQYILQPKYCVANEEVTSFAYIDVGRVRWSDIPRKSGMALNREGAEKIVNRIYGMLERNIKRLESDLGNESYWKQFGCGADTYREKCRNEIYALTIQKNLKFRIVLVEATVL